MGRPLVYVELPERSDGSTHYLTGSKTAMRTDSLMDGLIGSSSHGDGGWQNPLLGYGMHNRDKTIAGHFGEPLRLSDLEISALYNGNDIAQRIICAKAKEMFRRGWVLALPGQAPAQTSGAAPGTKGFAPKDNKPPVPTLGAKSLQPPPELAGKDKPKMRTDFVDPNADPQSASAKLANAQKSETEEGPAAPSPQAIPGADPDAKKPPGDQNSGADLAAKIEEYAGNLQLFPKAQEATIFGRAYGGGLLIIGADDGQDMAMPLNEDNVKSVRFLTFIDRRFIVAHSYYDQIGPKYGEVEVYNVINPFGNMNNSYVHESRCVRFDGAPVDLMMRRRLAGWTLSVLQAPYDTMRQFDTSFQSIAQLMSDMSQAVMKINGLAQLISNDQKTLQTRMQMVDMSRSSGRLIYLDAENEEFKREPTPLQGVADTLEMQMLRLAAAAEMPVAILFGREPSGLNATGDADFRRFYDMIAGQQKQELEPKLLRIYTLICKAKDGPTGGKVPDGGIKFVWHKLYEPSEKEQAEIRFLMAQADDLYIQNQTLLPEEVAMSRFRSGDIHLDTEIQGDLRREKLATAELPPSGAEKAKMDQQNKQDEMKIKATAVAAKPGAPGAGPPAK
jgi:phage-related protein (TIGR01555 family)